MVEMIRDSDVTNRTRRTGRLEETLKRRPRSLDVTKQQGLIADPILMANDTALEAMARKALHAADSALGSVVVEITNGRIVLIGSISSFYLKQIAQEAVRRVSGEAGFVNRLVVGVSVTSRHRLHMEFDAIIS